MAGLRERNRINAMRLTQRAALDLFAERGFDAVTVGEIAEAVGIAVSTIYRHFAGKEAVVLWDEHDPAVEEALIEALTEEPPFVALRRVFVEELGGRYDDDLEFQLRRIRYIYATEQLHAAAVEDDLRNRESLTEGLTHFLSDENEKAAPLIAGAAMLALDVAIDRWQQLEGRTPLGELIADAFDQLAAIDDLT